MGNPQMQAKSYIPSITITGMPDFNEPVNLGVVFDPTMKVSAYVSNIV